MCYQYLLACSEPRTFGAPDTDGTSCITRPSFTVAVTVTLLDDNTWNNNKKKNCLLSKTKARIKIRPIMCCTTLFYPATRCCIYCLLLSPSGGKHITITATLLFCCGWSHPSQQELCSVTSVPADLAPASGANHIYKLQHISLLTVHIP